MYSNRALHCKQLYVGSSFLMMVGNDVVAIDLNAWLVFGSGSNDVGDVGSSLISMSIGI